MHYKGFVFDHKGRYNELVDLQRSEFTIARVKPAFHKNIVLLPDVCRPFTNAYRIDVTDLYHMAGREELSFDGFVNVAKGKMYLGAMAMDVKKITKAINRLK